MTGVIDLGTCNLCSVLNALKHLNAEHKVIKTVTDFIHIDRVVLPGVGSYCVASESLKTSGLFECLQSFKQPILGICLGMQILSTYGEEGGYSEGLDLIGGYVRKITSQITDTLPHVGWNSVKFRNSSSIFANVQDDSDFYFVHSYMFDAWPEFVIGETEINYGQFFTSAAQNGNVFGVQFHPEKSDKAGLKVIENFLYA